MVVVDANRSSESRVRSSSITYVWVETIEARSLASSRVRLVPGMNACFHAPAQARLGREAGPAGHPRRHAGSLLEFAHMTARSRSRRYGASVLTYVSDK